MHEELIKIFQESGASPEDIKKIEFDLKSLFGDEFFNIEKSIVSNKKSLKEVREMIQERLKQKK